MSFRDYRTAEELARDEELEFGFGHRLRARRDGLFSAFGRSPVRRSHGAGAPATAEPAATPVNRAAETTPDVDTSFDAPPTLSPAGGRLYQLLTASARRVALRAGELQSLAFRINRALGERARADEYGVAQTLKIWTGLSLVVLGVFVANQIENALIAGVPVIRWGAPLGDAQILQRMFFLVGGAIAGAGLLAHTFAALRNRYSDDGIVRAADAFGRKLAFDLKEVDAALAESRETLGRPDLTNEQVASAVAEAHMTGQEATLLFQEVGFLLDRPDATGPAFAAEAQSRFRAFLDSAMMVPANRLHGAWFDGAILGVAAGGLIGALVGAVLGYKIAPTDAAAVTDLSLQSLGGIFNYMWAVGAIFAGVLMFVAADFIAEPIAGLAFGSSRGDRLRSALASVRGAITSENAPRSRDIAERIEDLAEIFRVRLGKTGSKLESMTHRADAAQAESAAPEWRRAPEAPRFVPPSFHMAPEKWLAGPGGARSREKYDPSKPADTGAKRSLFGLKKPSGT